MRLKYAVIGLAGIVMLGAPPAFAQFSSDVSITKVFNEVIEVTIDNTVDVNIVKDIKVTKDVTFIGTVTITGTINVERAALSVVDNKQLLDNNTVNSTDDNTATVTDDVLGLAVGSIQFNLAAGQLNAQDNAAALSTADGDDASADAEAFSIQGTAGGDITSSGANEATIVDEVLEGAEGNLQVNLAAGIANVQKNALSLATVANNHTLSEATAVVLQQHSFNSIEITGNPTNLAMLADNVFQSARGNIQINLAAGIGNAQNNSLVVAAGQQ